MYSRSRVWWRRVPTRRDFLCRRPAFVQLPRGGDRNLTGANAENRAFFLGSPKKDARKVLFPAGSSTQTQEAAQGRSKRVQRRRACVRSSRWRNFMIGSSPGHWKNPVGRGDGEVHGDCQHGCTIKLWHPFTQPLPSRLQRPAATPQCLQGVYDHNP